MVPTPLSHLSHRPRTPAEEAHFHSFIMEFAGAPLARKKTSSQHRTKRNLPYLEVFMLSMFPAAVLRGWASKPVPLTVHTHLEGGASLVQGGCVSGSLGPLGRVFVDSRGVPGLPELGLPFGGAVGAVLARGVLLLAKAWNLCLHQSSQKEPHI